MKYSKGMLYGVLGLILAHPAYANLDCVEQPTCSELGYSNTESCTTGGFIVCPFDPTYKKCVPERPDCEVLGFTDTPKDEWCEGENLIKCPTDTSYTLCAWHSFEEGCEASGYHTIDSTLLCTDEFVELPLSDGTTVTCATKCYTSCMDAGYDEAISASVEMYCEGGKEVFYKHKNKSEYDASVECGKTCHQVYDICEEAGKYSKENCDAYGGGPEYLYASEDGARIECYSSCSIWNTCEDMGYDYLSVDPGDDYTCVSLTINTVKGKTLHCYDACVKNDEVTTNSCVQAYRDCVDSCGGQTGTAGRTGAEISAYNMCTGSCDTALATCKNKLSFFRMDDMEKIKVASVSEDFAIEKYVKAFNFDEEDCPIYKL